MFNQNFSIMNGNYPAVAANDPYAPYNQPSEEEHDFNVVATATLSCETSVTSFDAYYECDEDGRYFNEENVDLKKDFIRERFTPIELIRYLKDMLEKDLAEKPAKSWDVRESALSSCKMWLAADDEEIEVEEV